MTRPGTSGRDRWRLRSVPQHLAGRYLAEGWWTDATLGQMVAGGLGRRDHVGFRVRSAVRPWEGTFADVDRAARSLAAELRARGVGPGSVVAFQLPAQEVEELLLGVEGIAEVSVVAAPDERLGERAAAVLRLRAGATAPTLADVRAHLAAAGLARQKWPESLHVVDELPRTPSGKVQKFRLRQNLRDGNLQTSFSHR